MNNPANTERLDKILAGAGYGSRSDVKKLIRSGAVSCDGDAVTAPEMKFSPETTRIEVGGVKITYNRFIYLVMNKPEGALCATYDPARRTVIDLLPERYRTRKMFPVGRLDKNTTGLLLLTDDGDFAHMLISPKKSVEKEYEALLDKVPGAEVAEAFGRGVILDGHIRLRPAKLTIRQTAGETARAPETVAGACGAGVSSPAAADAATTDAAVTTDPAIPAVPVRVIVTEGKYHQIKRMFSAFGINVIKLRRVRIGGICLDPALLPGEARELTTTELSSLYYSK